MPIIAHGTSQERAKVSAQAALQLVQHAAAVTPEGVAETDAAARRLCETLGLDDSDGLASHYLAGSIVRTRCGELPGAKVAILHAIFRGDCIVTDRFPEIEERNCFVRYSSVTTGGRVVSRKTGLVTRTMAEEAVARLNTGRFTSGATIVEVAS